MNKLIIVVQEYFPGSWKDSFLLDLDVPENVSSSKVFPQQQAIHAHYRNPKDVALALATSKHDDNTPNTLPDYHQSLLYRCTGDRQYIVNILIYLALCINIFEL